MELVFNTISSVPRLYYTTLKLTTENMPLIIVRYHDYITQLSNFVTIAFFWSTVRYHDYITQLSNTAETFFTVVAVRYHDYITQLSNDTLAKYPNH